MTGALLLVLLPLSPGPGRRGSATPPPTCDRKLSAIARRYRCTYTIPNQEKMSNFFQSPLQNLYLCVSATMNKRLYSHFRTPKIALTLLQRSPDSWYLTRTIKIFLSNYSKVFGTQNGLLQVPQTLWSPFESRKRIGRFLFFKQKQMPLS